MTTTHERRRARRAARRGPFAGYGGEEEMPLGGYASILGLFALGAGAASLLLRRAERTLPERPALADIALLGAGAHKLSRLLTKDWVTSPLRAAFVEYEGSAGRGEVRERSRGTGLRRALGDLLTCPWCTGAWVAAAMGCGLLAAPRLTRFVAGALCVELVSDLLNVGYEALRAGPATSGRTA